MKKFPGFWFVFIYNLFLISAFLLGGNSQGNSQKYSDRDSAEYECQMSLAESGELPTDIIMEICQP